MRLAETPEKFIDEISSKKHLVICGAGWAGKIVCRYLKSKGLVPAAFAVTDAVEAGRIIQDVPVYCLNDVLELFSARDLNLILAVTKHNQPSMEEELKRRGIQCYITLSDALLYVMAREERKLTAREAQAAKKAQDAEKEKSEKTVGYLVPGYLDTNYAEERLIIGKIEEAAYIPMPKETIQLPCIGTRYEKNMELHRKLTEACYCPEEYMPEVEIIHTFNTVCKTDKPWCAFFETSMPRVWTETEEEEDYFIQLAECMKKPNCKKLYALCRNAYEIQERTLLSKLAPEDAEIIMKKTEVLHLPQKVLVTEREFEQKQNAGTIHLFFRQGFFYERRKRTDSGTVRV